MPNSEPTRLTFKPQKALTGVLIGVWLLFLILIITLTYALQIDVYQPKEQVLLNYWYAITGMLLLFFGLYIYQSAFRKLIIDSISMTYSSLFKKHKVLLSEIKGVRKNASYIDKGVEILGKPQFIPKKNSTGKKISTFQNKELSLWAKTNFIDLDVADHQKEVSEILADKTLGLTVEERATKIKQAQILRTSITGIGLFLVLVAILFDLPRYVTVLYITISSAVILTGLLYFKGLIRMEWGTAYVSMARPVLFIFILFILVRENVGIVSLPIPKLRMMLIYLGLCTIVCTFSYILLLIGKSKYKFKKIWMTLLLFTALFVSNGIALNILLDQSEPKSFTTTITTYKETTYRGISYSYEMHLELWSKEGGAYNEINVSRDTYLTLAPGTKVDIVEYQGAFDYKWFTVHHDGKELNDAESYFGRNKQEVPWATRRP